MREYFFHLSLHFPNELLFAFLGGNFYPGFCNKELLSLGLYNIICFFRNLMPARLETTAGSPRSNTNYKVYSSSFGVSIYPYRRTPIPLLFVCHIVVGNRIY